MKSTDDKFEPAEIEIILFTTEDVITTSNPFDGSGDPAEQTNSPKSAEEILNMCIYGKYNP